jgi:hypothetical protein
MKLFGGVISWQANELITVPTSATEAELLALSQAAKESLFVSRLLKELDGHRIKILCNNTQTIKIVDKKIGQLHIKLRHVGIYNYRIEAGSEAASSQADDRWLVF